MLSKSVIQFSADGQGCVPSLLFDLMLEGNGTPLQYSGRENSMDCTVHGVQMSDFHFYFTIV